MKKNTQFGFYHFLTQHQQQMMGLVVNTVSGSIPLT